MGIQSAVMAEQFGTLFQYGKRRISAMSNDEFNALTFKDLQDKMTKQIEDMIPTMQTQIEAMRPMTKIIIEEFLQYLTAAGNALNPFSTGPSGETATEAVLEAAAHTVGTHYLKHEEPFKSETIGAYEAPIGPTQPTYTPTTHDTFIILRTYPKGKTGDSFELKKRAKAFIQRGNLERTVTINSVRITNIAAIPSNYYEVNVTVKVNFTLS